MKCNILTAKKVITTYFDSLTNRIDFYTEQQLLKYSDTDVVVVNDLSTMTGKTYKSVVSGESSDCNKQQKRLEETQVRDYLNTTREEMIKMLSQTQSDVFEQLELVKDKLKSKKIGKICANVFAKRFPILVQVNSYQEDFSINKRPEGLNSSPFKLYLVVLDFYINQSDIHFLR